MRSAPEPISVDEALRTTRTVIEVAAKESETIGLRSERYQDAFCIANIRSFDDLQSLGLVPRGISEEASRSALAEDDREYQARFQEFQARHADSRSKENCHCDDGRSQVKPVSRRRTQSNLSALLPERYRSSVEGPNSGVVHVYQHLRRWFDKPAMYLVGLVRAQGIVIGFDSTLTMDATVSVVHASFINISSGGRLKFLAGMVNVRCDSLDGPSSAGDPPPYHPPPDGGSGWPPPGPWPPLRTAEETAEKYLQGYSKVRRAY